MSLSKLSIITVVKNDATALELTLKSIDSQTYRDFEHIIIDGDSNDGSVDILKNFSSYTIKYISEIDSGIYDAMNKGLALAKSQWVLFINAGDRFVDKHALQNWIAHCREEYHFIYCNIYRTQNYDLKKLWIQKPPFKFKWYRNICHQSILYNTKMLGSFHYDTDYSISADFHLLLKFLTQKHGLSFCKVEQSFLEYKSGGVSQKFAMKALFERWKSFNGLIENKYLKIWNLLNLSRQILRLFLVQKFSSIAKA